MLIEELLAIKRGALTYDEVLKMAEELMSQIEKEATLSKLPNKPNSYRIEAVLVKMRAELYAH